MIGQKQADRLRFLLPARLKHKTKVALDFGLGALSFSSVGIAIFIGVNIINKEIESRTIYIILSQPISRHSFLIGRTLGMILLLCANIAILATLTLIIYFIFGGIFQPLMIWCVLFVLLESVIVLNIAILFSLITNITMSVVYTIILFTLGHAVSEVLELTKGSHYADFHSIVKFSSYFLPDLSKINIKEFVLYQESLGAGYLFKAGSYGITYIIILMLISNLIFRKKDLN